LLLRAETGGAETELAEWWTRFHLADEAEQLKMTQAPRQRSNKKPGRKRNYRKKNQSPKDA
jgi:poly(A) polymerase